MEYRRPRPATTTFTYVGRFLVVCPRLMHLVLWLFLLQIDINIINHIHVYPLFFACHD